MATKKLFSFTLTLFLFFFSLNGEKTRDYLTTGGWYPASRATLNSTLNQLMNKAKTTTAPGRIRALIGPHAGLTYSGMCAANGYKQLENLRETERIFILGVSHKGGFYGACVSDFVFNTTPLGKIPVDTTITQKLAKEKYFRINNQIMQHEHSIENHLPFIQKIYKNKKIKIIPILFGQLQKKDFKVLANTIKKYIDEKTLVIASSDFTHYGRNFGYAPFKKNVKHNLTKLDMGMIEKILKNDFNGYVNTKMKTGITMCGFTPVGVLLNIFSGNRYKGKLIDYYKSGDSNNDYSFSVSYASIIIYEKNR